MTAPDIFTEGLYTPDQAARLAQVSTKLLRNWVYGSLGREAAVVPRIPENDAKVIGFIDLIQVLAIRAIRVQKKLSLPKIRATVNAAHERGILYPFARKHQTFLFDDDVVIQLELPDGKCLVQVTGKYKNHHLLHPVVEQYLVDLSYDPDGLANEFTPLSDGDSKIIINPKKQYGAPIVLPSGYTVASLVSAYEGEGSISEAAAAFEIDETQVKLAIRYDNFLSGIAA
jgi:uncharacterized protein (DUF433 family)